MRKKLALVSIFACLSGLAVAGEGAGKSLDAQFLEQRVTKVYEDDNLLYAGKGKYVTLADFTPVTVSEDGKKLLAPNLRELNAGGQKILNVMGVKSSELIKCFDPERGVLGNVQEIVGGLHLDKASGKWYLYDEYVGLVTDNYMTAVSYPSFLAPQGAENNYYAVVTRIVNRLEDGDEVENYNLTLGFCKGDHADRDLAYEVATPGDITLNNKNGGVTLTLNATDENGLVKKVYTFGGQGIGLTYMSNYIFSNAEFVNEFKAAFLEKKVATVTNNAPAKEEVQEEDSDIAEAFAIFSAIYSQVKKGKQNQNTATNAPAETPTVAEVKPEEAPKGKMSAEDQAKFGELVVKYFGEPVALFFSNGFADMQDGAKVVIPNNYQPAKGRN